MKCEACGESEATVHFKQVSEGVSMEMHLCEECASETDFTAVAETSITDVLFGAPFQPHGAEGRVGSDKECPICHMKEEDYRRLSRLGCAACYETFCAELLPLLHAMHRSTTHAGRAPQSEAVNAQILAFEKDMDEAVNEQDFERAAMLRDRISELKKARAAAGMAVVEGAL